MTSKEFEEVVESQFEICENVLFNKAKEYAKDDDRLHNFKTAAALMGDTPIKALAGMMRKHTVSVYDMCESGQDYPIELWDEKITDHINYLLLLKAAVLEGKANSAKTALDAKATAINTMKIEEAKKRIQELKQSVNMFDGSEV